MYTLLKLFYLPRLKNLTWQILLLNFVFIISVFMQNLEVMGLCAIGAFYILFYNYMMMNFTDNLEWLRISVYSPKKLLSYYFLEQTLMFFTTIFYFLFTIGSAFLSMFLFKINFGDKVASQASKLESNSGLMSLTSQFQDKIHEYAVSSPTETALELVFYFATILSFIYGGQLLKTYFMRLHFERKFSREAKAFQALMVTFFLLFMVVDGKQLTFMHQFKIVIMPFMLAFGFFTLLHAANQSYKIFRLKPNSMIVKAPIGVFLVVFAFSFAFSKINFGSTKDLNEKIAERKFMGILGSDLESDFVLKAYYNDELNVQSLKYLMSNHPLTSDDHFYKLVSKYDFYKASALDEMWPVDKLEEEKRLYLFTHLNQEYMNEKNDRLRKRYMAVFNEDFSKVLKEKQEDYKGLSIYKDFLDSNDKEAKRSIASE